MRGSRPVPNTARRWPGPGRIRSIALSQAYHFDNGRVVPWETCEELAPALLQKLIGLSLPEGVFLNVNFPNCLASEVEGTIVTAQGKLAHGLFIEERQDGRGFPYYWLRFGRGAEEPADGTDLLALRSRCVRGRFLSRRSNLISPRMKLRKLWKRR